jgi:hypothetical protein
MNFKVLTIPLNIISKRLHSDKTINKPVNRRLLSSGKYYLQGPFHSGILQQFA